MRPFILHTTAEIADAPQFRDAPQLTLRTFKDARPHSCEDAGLGIDMVIINGIAVVVSKPIHSSCICSSPTRIQKE